PGQGHRACVQLLRGPGPGIHAPRPTGAGQRGSRHHPGGLGEEAAAGDPEALPDRNLRPRPRERAAGELGGSGDGPEGPRRGGGWAYATIGYGDIQPDRPDRWTEGVIGLTLKDGQKKPAADEWGTISAWAWGVGRCIDYLVTDKAIDSKRVAITGASRLGKTVLWAGAQDERVAAV